MEREMMKRGMGRRQIVCENCGRIPSEVYDGEWAKKVFGRAKKDYTCDECMAEIKKGSRCCAESIGLVNHAYIEWEDDFGWEDDFITKEE